MSTNWFVDVIRIHDKFFGEELREKVAAMPKSIRHRLLEFRRMFIAEELNELRAATNPEEVVDALIDIIVVATGTLYMFDVDAQKAWDEVHRANVDKEVGIKESRPNPFGFPDLIKPPGWVPPSHAGNTGSISSWEWPANYGAELDGLPHGNGPG